MVFLKHVWMDQLDSIIRDRHMLSHPFYQSWSAGTLELETLQEYAKEYYQHVKAFPTYLSAVHSQSEDKKIRRSLLSNLIDEEVGTPNHLDLWRSFGISLGIAPTEMDIHTPSASTQQLIAVFRELCQSKFIFKGLTALYSYESQIPEICSTKIEGLKKWYGFTNPEGYLYFSLHETIDKEHAKEERELLMNVIDETNKKDVFSAAKQTLEALWNFLSSFCPVMTI